MPDYRIILSSIGGGVLYGLFARFIFSLDILTSSGASAGMSLMSFAFLFLVPFAVGFFTGYTAKEKASVVYFIFAPWITVTLVIISALFLHLEGLICIIMALPIFLVIGTLGGLTAFWIIKASSNRIRNFALCTFLILPFAAIPFENKIEKPKEIIDINTSVFIKSDAQDVWNNIVKVYDIKESENGKSLFLTMGFPRPIKAELDKEEVGGVRKAIFEKGLFFTETVTQWDPMRSFTFNIKADPGSIPPEALDEHVTVGGEFFDVLEGKYEIQQMDEGVMLHLTSKFRVSTSFNFYSKMWCKIIMKDIQNNILHVIQSRCETDKLAQR